MTQTKLRRQIAFEAAQLMYQRQESEYYRAKMKAAKRICRGWVKPADLPSNAEIRDQVQILARTFEGESRTDRLLDMRLDALRMMRLLSKFRPRLIGSALTGHIRQGSDIDLHVFAESSAPVAAALDFEGIVYDIEKKRVRKFGEETVYTHIHVEDRFPLELTVYPISKANYGFKSSITGKAIEKVNIAELELFLATEYPQLDIESELDSLSEKVDRFQVFLSLLLPLENVKQNPKFHPEGDALYHSLQVFELARDELPYDEEFLTAALLHDVGKGIDADDHVAAGLESLEGMITERTAWLIKYHMEAHKVRDGSIGSRARKRLASNENFEDLMLLCECDEDGRQCGVEVCEVEDALDYLRDLERMC